MACGLLEILGVADGRDGCVEIAFDLVADMLGAVAVFFDALGDGEVGMLEAIVGDGVGAEVLVRRACRASLPPLDCARRLEGGRRHMIFACSRGAIARTVPVGIRLWLRFLFPM